MHKCKGIISYHHKRISKQFPSYTPRIRPRARHILSSCHFIQQCQRLRCVGMSLWLCLLRLGHPLHLLRNPPPLLKRTFQPSNKQRPDETHRQMSLFLLLLPLTRYSLNPRQLDNLVHGLVHPVRSRVNSECHPVQVDETSQKVSYILSKRPTHFHCR